MLDSKARLDCLKEIHLLQVYVPCIYFLKKSPSITAYK